MGQGLPAELPGQGAPVGAQQVDVVAHPGFHGDALAALVGQKTAGGGQLGENFRLFENSVRQVVEIALCRFRAGVGPGEKQRVQLGLGRGDGNDFHYVFFIRIILHGGAAAHAVMGADRIAHGKAVKQRGDKLRF